MKQIFRKLHELLILYKETRYTVGQLRTSFVNCGGY